MERFDEFRDVVLDLEAVLGRSAITVQKLLDLTPGTVLPLRNPAGEDVELVLGGVVIGSCETAVAEDTLAVRITSLEEPH